jgi:hypothetical protein
VSIALPTGRSSALRRLGVVRQLHPDGPDQDRCRCTAVRRALAEAMSANTALRFVCALIAVAIPTFAMLALIVTVANPPPRVNVLLAFIAAGVVVYLGWAER